MKFMQEERVEKVVAFHKQVNEYISLPSAP